MNRFSLTGGLVSDIPRMQAVQRMTPLVVILLLLIALGFPTHSSAQIELKSWELQNNLGYEPNGDPLLQADANAPGICATCGDVRRGGGLGIPPSGRLHTIVSNEWDAVTLAEARSFAEYYKISIRPSAGQGIRLTSIALRLGRTTNGPNRFALFSNVNGDNFTTQIGPDIVVPGTSLVDTLYFPDSLFANCTTDAPVDFRLYGWVDGGGQNQFAQAWIGNVGGGGAGNDVIISGYVEPLPLPFNTTVFDDPHCYGETDNLLRRLQVGPNSLPGPNEEVVWRVVNFLPGPGSDASAFVGGEFTSADNPSTQDEFQTFNSGRSFRPVAEPVGINNQPLFGTYILDVRVRNTITGCTSPVYGPLQKEIRPRPVLAIPNFPPVTCSGSGLASGDFAGFQEVNGLPFASIDVLQATVSPDLTPIVGPTTGTGLSPDALDNDAYRNLSNGGRLVTYTIVLQGSNGCASEPTDFSFRILAEPQGQPDTIYRCNDEVTGYNISLLPGSWGDVNGPPNLVQFAISIQSNGLVASAGNPMNGSCLAYTDIADDAWTNNTSATVPVVYTLTPVRGCGSPDECSGQPFDIVVYVAPALELHVYDPGTNNPVADPFLICESSVNANAADWQFDVDAHVDVQVGEFMRYFWLGMDIQDPNGAGVSQTSTFMGPAQPFPPAFNPGEASLIEVSSDLSISDPALLVEPVELTHIFGGPAFIMANGHICGNNDPANWTEVHARIVPSPRLDFVFRVFPTGHDGHICPGSTTDVGLVLDPDHPGLTEGVDYEFVLDNIAYSLDGITFFPGYGPVQGGGYNPSPFGQVGAVVPGVPGLTETLTHSSGSPVWVRYNFFTRSLDPSTNCDGEFRGFTLVVDPEPEIDFVFNNPSSGYCPNDNTICNGDGVDVDLVSGVNGLVEGADFEFRVVSVQYKIGGDCADPAGYQNGYGPVTGGSLMAGSVLSHIQENLSHPGSDVVWIKYNLVAWDLTTCGNHDYKSIWVGVNPEPEIDFVFNNPSSGYCPNDNTICNGDGVDVDLVSGANGLVEGADFEFRVVSVQYKIGGDCADLAGYQSGYGPVTGGSLMGGGVLSDIQENLSHPESDVVWIKYNLVAWDLSSCSNHDYESIWVGIDPEPEIDFVFIKPSSGYCPNDNTLCHGDGVHIDLVSGVTGLVEGLDFDFRVVSIQYKVGGDCADPAGYQNGYGPVTGGMLFDGDVLSSIQENLSHSETEQVWIKYNLVAWDLSSCGNHDYESIWIGVAPRPYVICPSDQQVVTSANGFGDCTADASWTHPVPAPACDPVTLDMLTEYGIQNVTPGDAILLSFTGTGPHLVQYNAYDGAGNLETCTFSIDVVDDEPPVPYCTNGLSVYLNVAGQASITPATIDAGSTDNCGIQSITLDRMDFTCDDVGVVNLQLTVTDESNNTAFCETAISVVDTISPVAVCVTNQVRYLDANGAIQLVASSLDAGSTDACGIVDRTVSPSSFTCADKGDNPVTLTVSDPSGNTASCQTLITVLDTISPVLHCPVDQVITLDPGACRTVVNYDVTATDNCPFAPGGPVIEQTLGLVSGSVFERGLVNNCFRVMDDSGNEGTCCFTIEVLEFPVPSATLACNDLVQISLDEDCITDIGADLILEGGPYGCYEDYIVMIFNEQNQPLASSPNVGAAQIGKTLTVKVTDPETGNSCWGAILVEDKMPPKLNCPTVDVQCGDLTDPDHIPSPDPATSDNCDSWTDLTWEDTVDDLGCAGGAYTRIINRYWIGVDDSGNLGYCNQQIRVIRPTLAILDELENYDGTDQPVFDCAAGYPTVDLIPFPGGNGCGAIQTFYEDKVLSICAGSYSVLRTWTVLDMCTSEVDTRLQTIKVIDQTPPQLTCPDEHDIQIAKLEQNGYQDCQAKVLLPKIQVEDNCSVSPQINVYVVVTFPNGSVQVVNTPNADGKFELTLPVGYTYQVTYEAIDDCGNKGQCSFAYTLEDKQGPTVVCETFHVVSLSDSVTLVNASAFDDGSWDVCTSVTFSARRMDNPQCAWNDETAFGPTIPFYCCDATGGPIMVEMQVADAFGNTNSCMVEVQVVDKIKPVIWCPEDITVQCGMPYTPTETDTFNICMTPSTVISGVVPYTYVVPINIAGIPEDARITDLDLGLHIQHEYVNQLSVTLYSPLGKKATVLSPNACPPPTQSWYPMDINVTFNDEAYDLAYFNLTGTKIPAPFTCSTFLPSIGAYNQGQMKPQDDPLIAFDGQPLNSVTNADACLTVGSKEVDPGTNRIYGSAVATLISTMAVSSGDEVVLTYVSAKGGVMGGLEVGRPYLFKVINGNTLEFLDVLGTDLTGVPIGSTHEFCQTNTWLLVVKDHAALAGGTIHKVCLAMEYVTSTGLKPHATDNTEACGLTVDWDDLGDPGPCADNTFINRRWKATDAFGNNTTCIQRVYFRDDTPFLIQFPCDVTIDCEDLDALDMTGEVVHNGDCEQVGIQISDQKLTVTDACYKILRTWTVKNNCAYQADGNVDYTVSSVDPAVNGLTFSVAINALISARGLKIGDALTLRYITSTVNEIGGMVEGDVYQLIYLGGTSFRVDWNATKQQAVVISSSGSGTHIFRYGNSDRGIPVSCDDLQQQSPLTDWQATCAGSAGCIAWEDDGDGYFRYVQEIKVIDQDPPKIVDCHYKVLCSYEEDCSTAPIELIGIALDNCTPEDQIVWTYKIDAFNDGSIDVTGNGKNASGIYPLGTHAVIWQVSDQCGNLSSCSQIFIVKDCLKPTPICHAVSIDLMPSTGTAEVWASSLEVGESKDNCTAYGDLQILVERFSDVSPGQDAPDADAGPSILVTCDDLPPNAPDSVVMVAVWVGDEAGNWDYCVTTISVQDWMGACGGTMMAELTSYIADETGEPVEQVSVDLTGNGTNLALQTTGSTGSVSFGSIPASGQYAITPQKDINPLNGVSTYDLLLMQKHLLGIKALSSPYKLIAADVNNNCNISISDIIELRKMILAPGINFGNNTSWRFVEAGYAFPNPAKPCNFMEMKSFNGLQPGLNSAGFIGVKIGDVNGDAMPNSLLGVETRNSHGKLELAIDDRAFAAGETFVVEVKAGNFTGIQGYQYTMDFDPEVLEIVEVEAVWTDLSGSNFGQSRLQAGILTTSWNASAPITLAADQVLYRVKVKALASGRLSEQVTVNSKVTRAEAYDRDEQLLEVRFRFDNGVTAGGGFALYQNEPNPFGDMTRIGFQLPEGGEAVLTVHDVTGKLVYTARAEFHRGYNEFILRGTDVSARGMLYYTVQSGEHMATRRMIMQE